MRIAYAPTLFEFDVDGEVSQVVDESVTRLSQAFGITPDVVEPGWQDPIRTFETLWVAGRGVAYGRQAANGHLGAGFAALVEHSASYTLADYLDAMKARAVFAAEVHEFFERYDILLLPTVPILPFDADLEKPPELDPTSEILPWTVWTPFTYPFNLSGNPAASIPSGLSPSGLPVGLQVVGRRHADSTVLCFCRLLEERAGFHLPPIGEIATQKGDATTVDPTILTTEELS